VDDACHPCVTLCAGVQSGDENHMRAKDNKEAAKWADAIETNIDAASQKGLGRA
jgi:hypothetical protein